MMLLVGDAYNYGGDDIGGDCENGLGPYRHPDPQPIVIQWAGHVAADKISRIAREGLAITAESGSSPRRPHCRRPETHARLEHSTLPPLLLWRKFAVCVPKLLAN